MTDTACPLPVADGSTGLAIPRGLPVVDGETREMLVGMRRTGLPIPMGAAVEPRPGVLVRVARRG